jgi:hypothetical protein
MGQDDLTLEIGLDDGSCLRYSIDPVTGAMGTVARAGFSGHDWESDIDALVVVSSVD